MKIQSNVIVTAFVGAEALDQVLSTCNYEASGDGCVLVDTDQLDNTQDTTGVVGKMSKEIQQAIKDVSQLDYTGLILLRA
jgi:hypothetical protein